MKKNVSLILLLSILITSLFAQNQSPAVYQFSLEDCLNYALGHNYNLQSMKLAEESQIVDYRQAKQEYLPSVSASLGENLNSSKDTASYRATFGGNANLSVSMPIYQGGKINNTLKQNRLRTELAETQTSQYENTLTINILQAFLTVLGNEELLRYQQNVIKASEEQFRQGQLQYQYGKILESDYLLLEAQLANDRNNILNTQIAHDNSLLALKHMLAISATDSLELISPDTAVVVALELMPSLATVLEETINTLPDLKISQYNIDIAGLSVKLAKAGYIPSVNLSGNISTGHSNFNNFGQQLADRFSQQVGVSVSIPIYDRGQTRAQVHKSQIALKQAELDKKQTELDITQTVTSNYRDVVSACGKYRTQVIRQNAYSKTFEVYHAQFNAGAITAVDLLQQQNNYLNALSDFIQSKYEFILKRKILDVYMGKKIGL